MRDILKGKIALVVGASGEIGSATARLLAEHGASVGIGYCHNREKALHVVDAVHQYDKNAAIFRADITQYLEAENMIAEVIRHFGQLDIVVNCAGIVKDNAVQFLSETEWSTVIDTNLKGPLYVCKAASQHMIRRKSGKIVNIASVTGLIGQELRTNYGASKGGLIALTKSIARELAPFGIQVNAIAPQIVEGGVSLSASKKFITETSRYTPAGRIGKSLDVARVVMFLVSELSDFIVGEVIYVTGGLFTHQI